MNVPKAQSKEKKQDKADVVFGEVAKVKDLKQFVSLIAGIRDIKNQN